MLPNRATKPLFLIVSQGGTLGGGWLTSREAWVNAIFEQKKVVWFSLSAQHVQFDRESIFTQQKDAKSSTDSASKFYQEGILIMVQYNPATTG